MKLFLLGFAAGALVLWFTAAWVGNFHQFVRGLRGEEWIEDIYWKLERLRLLLEKDGRTLEECVDEAIALYRDDAELHGDGAESMVETCPQCSGPLHTGACSKAEPR